MGETTNLGIFGTDYQNKLMSLLITDRQFLIKMLSVLKPTYFDNRSLRWLCESLYFYFKEYKTLPTLDVFKVQVQNIKNDTLLQSEVVHSLKSIWGHIGSDDGQFIRDTSIGFCKRQLIGETFHDCLGDYERGNYDEISRKFNAVVQQTIGTEINGHNYVKDIDYRYNEENEPMRIPTPWQPLNDITGGGLPIGKFGMIMAPTGAGKSWMAAALGLYALQHSFKVLHYTLELDDRYTGRRYDSLLLKTPFDDLKYNVQSVRSELGKIGENLYIIERQPSNLTISELEMDIDRYTLLGLKPNLVIIDAPYLMKIPYTSTMADHKTLGEFYKDLRGLAGVKGFGLWGVDQVNREGSTKDEIGNDSISDSYAKLFALDFVASLSRKSKDKINSGARFHVTKSRLGPDGMTFPMKFDTNGSVLEMYHERSNEGKRQRSKEITDDEFTKIIASQRFEQIKTMNQHRTEPDSGYF
jgi:hypothetical protein